MAQLGTTLHYKVQHSTPEIDYNKQLPLDGSSIGKQGSMLQKSLERFNTKNGISSHELSHKTKKKYVQRLVRT